MNGTSRRVFATQTAPTPTTTTRSVAPMEKPTAVSATYRGTLARPTQTSKSTTTGYAEAVIPCTAVAHILTAIITVGRVVFLDSV